MKIIIILFPDDEIYDIHATISFNPRTNMLFDLRYVFVCLFDLFKTKGHLLEPYFLLQIRADNVSIQTNEHNMDLGS